MNTIKQIAKPPKPLLKLLEDKEIIPTKLIISEEINYKINYLCNKINNTEWSGVLFYSFTGVFEKDLVITVEDILPLNIGNVTYTEFDGNDVDIPNYIIDNNLINCRQGLIHSHHNMSTFFSNTDLNTLSEEGENNIHFVSLIVNNDNEYSAAITSKIRIQKKITTTTTTNGSFISFEGRNYNGNDDSETVEIIDEYIIKYSNMEILIENSNKLTKINTLIEKAKEKNRITAVSKYQLPVNNFINNFPHSTKNIKEEEVFVEDNYSIYGNYGDEYIDTYGQYINNYEQLNNNALHIKEDLIEDILNVEELLQLDNEISKIFTKLITGNLFLECKTPLTDLEIIRHFTAHQKNYPDKEVYKNLINVLLEYFITEEILCKMDVFTTEQLDEEMIITYTINKLISNLNKYINLEYAAILLEILKRML